MKRYLAEYRGLMAALGVFVVMVHGSKLSSGIIGIDTEDIIRLQGDFYTGWQQSGRQGLVLLKRLLGTFDFNPYFAGGMTLVLLWAAVLAFLSLWESVWKEASQRQGAAQRQESAAWGKVVGGFLWISHPVLTEQLYFSLQSVEICMGLLLTALALHLARRGIQKRHKGYIAGCFLLLLLILSLYQIFAVVYVFGVLSMLALQFFGGIVRDKRVGYTEIWKAVLSHGGLFLAAFSVNMVITGLFFNAGAAYLSGQIQWGRVSIKEGFLRILDHGFRVCTGYRSLYYNAGFGLLALAVACLAVRKVWKHRRDLYGLLWLLMVAALLSTPFWMTFLCAGAPVVRSQLVLPAVTCFMAYLADRLGDVTSQMGDMTRQLGAVTRRLGDVTHQLGAVTHRLVGNRGRFGTRKAVVKNGIVMAAVLVSAIVILCQVQTTLRLYYTDACRYEQDAALGRDIINAADNIGSADGLVVIGSRPFSPNNACVVGETIGHSFFDFDTGVEPQCYWSTRRVVGFLHTLGYHIGHAPSEVCLAAVRDSAGKPDFPQEGSVWRMGDVVVVKLSDCL